MVDSDRNKQGRAYNPGRPLSMSDRERILQLYEKGHKISHIARMIGVTHSCVSKIMTRYRRTGSMYPRSYSTGLLTSGRNSFDLAESASDCGASTTSEEWIAAESPASSYPSQTAEEPSKSSFAPEHPDKVREDVVVTPTTTLRAKISAYSIEREAPPCPIWVDQKFSPVSAASLFAIELLKWAPAAYPFIHVAC
ncbi:unnamed protein product [Heligmosomoides polygyrus]|uniref:Paired domain-containing protein n=1 Tax=Heligmosomoides polygyrus TaxID=6339 RepID=A0A3P8DIS7_HELPZ|nr:unnamed protein product [Heligmosomoides polygyrus]